MESTLVKIKAFIQTYEGLLSDGIPASRVDEIKAFISESFSMLAWKIEQLNKHADEDFKSVYISEMQFELTNLTDTSVFDDSETEITGENNNVASWISQVLFDFLDALRTRYRPWFNVDAKLPKRYLYKQHNLALSSFSSIENLRNKNIDPDLLLLLDGFSNAAKGSGPILIHTWRQYDFVVDFFLLLNNIASTLPGDDRNLMLMRLLIQQDFNSIHIYAYFMNYIGKISAKDTTFTEQQEELLYLQKVFLQIRPAAGTTYDPGVHLLKDSVHDCILAELGYIVQKEKLHRENFMAGNGNKLSRFYFEMMLTLAELMFLIRVMLETGMMKTKFKTHIYEFVSSHIRFQRAEKPSVKSMRNNFSNKPFPDRIVQKVRAWLVKLIEHIDQYYKIQF